MLVLDFDAIEMTDGQRISLLPGGEVLDGPVAVSGNPVLPGFALNVPEIW